MAAELTRAQREALDAYWSAATPEQERDAVKRLLDTGYIAPEPERRGIDFAGLRVIESAHLPPNTMVVAPDVYEGLVRAQAPAAIVINIAERTDGDGADPPRPPPA